MDLVSQIKFPVENELKRYEELYKSHFDTQNPYLTAIFAHLQSTKGKKIRPILTLLAAKLCGEITEQTYQAAISLELLHTASLIHDDVVDESFQRRGVSSVNNAFNNKVAVLSGDYILSIVLGIAGGAGDLRFISALANLGKALADGELIQLAAKDQIYLEEERYIDIITKKTASLFMNCFYMSAISSGASEEQTNNLVEFGRYLGLCFQIKDDIFDYSDSEEIGKPTANDIRERKITLPLIYTINNASAELKEDILKRLSKSELEQYDIDFLVSFARENGGIKYAENIMYDYKAKALALLADFNDGEVKQALITALDYIIDRTK